MAVTDLLTKKPFYRLQNSGLKEKSAVKIENMKYTEKALVGMPMTQTEFAEEYYPSAHRITSEVFFPECYNYGKVITEEGEELETMYREETFRVTVPLQAVITVQHLVHMFGNDVHHELTDTKVSDTLQDNFYDFQTGWLTKNMDIALYKLGRSAAITGDGAMVFYYNRGKLGIKNLSFLEGDTCYPHYDSITGELYMFARKFSSFERVSHALPSGEDGYRGSSQRGKELFRHGRLRGGGASAARLLTLPRSILPLQGERPRMEQRAVPHRGH